MKRALSLVLVLFIVLSLIPVSAFATDLEHTHNYEAVVTAPTCTEQGYTTYTCACGDSYVDDYVDATEHSYKNGICTICKFEPSTTLVITEFVNGTYSNNSLTSYPNTRLRHDPISVKAGDQCSFSLPDGWSGYICLAYRDQNWDYAPKAWVQEYSYTFPADMDAFVVMRKDDGSVISPEEYAGEITFTRKEANYESSTELVIKDFVNGTYSGNSLTFYPNTRLRHDPISVKAGDQCSFSLPDGWSGYICLAYRDQDWDYTPKAWVQEYSYTFPADMDAFVVMRKDDGSVISPEEYAGEIIFTRNEANPDIGVHFQGYYQKEIDKTIESVKALIGDEPCLVFPMVSDIHYLESTEVSYSFDYFIANLKELAKEIDFDFIACLGDITEGDTTQEITSAKTTHVINGFTQLGVPYYQVIGNHDDNRYGDATFTHEQLYENYLSTIQDVVFDTSSMHKTNYYKDFDDLGIRCIFLNANTNGAYGYSDETCDWFDEAIKTENGIIVFTHIPPVPAQNYGAKYGTDRGSTRIREACENADNFLIMFSGHNHYDLLITEPFLSFTMNCQKFENENGDPNLWAEGAVKPQRVAGTETEDCFDIVVVRPESGLIDLVRFGAGEDRFFMIESMHTHFYTPTVTAPTCTEQGYTTHTCPCGDSYVDGYVDASGHSFTDYISDGNATYEADGTKTALCDQGCGEKDTLPDPGSRLFPEQVTSSVYDITGGILGKVPVGTTVSELLAGLDWGKYCTVFDANGKAMDASAKVATGMVVKLMRGAEVKQTLTIAVRGDTNGDGGITLTDFVQIKAHLLQKQMLTGAAATAADYSADGAITITDFIQVKALLLKKTPQN